MKMKSFILPVVLSFLSAVQAGDLCKCKEPVPPCKLMGEIEYNYCTSLIASRRIRFETCESPSTTIKKTYTITPRQPTVTITSTTKPSTVTTTKVTTITQTDAATKQDTTTILNTETTITTETSTQSTTLTISETTTEVDIVTYTGTATITTASTTTVQWIQETCPVAKRDMTLGARHNDLPRDCSCLLTSTKSTGPAKTLSYKVTKPVVTHTTVKTVKGNYPTPTKTITSTSTKRISGAPLPTSTITSIIIKIEISTSIITTTLETTALETISTTTSTTLTSTETQTTLATKVADPCAPENLSKIYPLPGAPSSPNVVLASMSDGFGNPTTCCYNCLWNHDCVFWAISNDGQTCYGYYTKRNIPVEGCTTGMCTRGHPVLAVGGTDDRKYGLGNCGDYPGY